jgi:hypothetical protein
LGSRDIIGKGSAESSMWSYRLGQGGGSGGQYGYRYWKRSVEGRMEGEAGSTAAGAVGSEADGMGADDEARVGVDNDVSTEVIETEDMKVVGIGAVPTEMLWTRWVL